MDDITAVRALWNICNLFDQLTQKCFVSSNFSNFELCHKSAEYGAYVETMAHHLHLSQIHFRLHRNCYDVNLHNMHSRLCVCVCVSVCCSWSVVSLFVFLLPVAWIWPIRFHNVVSWQWAKVCMAVNSLAGEITVFQVLRFVVVFTWCVWTKWCPPVGSRQWHRYICLATHSLKGSSSQAGWLLSRVCVRSTFVCVCVHVLQCLCVQHFAKFHTLGTSHTWSVLMHILSVSCADLMFNQGEHKWDNG